MLVLMLLGAVLAAGQPQNDFQGRPLVRIDFEPAAQPISRSELDALLSLRPGQPLDMEEVRKQVGTGS